MIKVYRDKEVMTADPDQIPALEKAGWSITPPDVTRKKAAPQSAEKPKEQPEG